MPAKRKPAHKTRSVKRAARPRAAHGTIGRDAARQDGTAATPAAPSSPTESAHDSRIRMSAPVVSAPPRSEPTPGSPPASAAPPAEGGAAPAATDPQREQLERVFSPEIAQMLLTTAFGVAAVATGEPDIWQAHDEEIEPIAPALGRQLARIPIVRMIGPDNTEAGIVVLGIGVMVTRRLNEHASRKQQRAAEARGVAAGETARTEPDPAELARARARRSGAAAAAAPASGSTLEQEDGSRAAYFGMRT